MNPAEYEAMYHVEDGLWWYTGMRRITASLLGDRLGRGKRILDAGCGTGGNLRWLAECGTAYGVDLSPIATGFCARRGLATVARASVLALPYPDQTFDLVTSFDVVYHLDVADDVGALREMCRVLRPGGWAFIRVPAFEQLRSHHDAAVHTRQRYTLDELCSRARLAGLVPARSSYVNSLLFPLAALSRLGARFLNRDPGVHASDVRPAAPLVNRIFRVIMAAEAALLERVDLPVGLSAALVAQRPATLPESGAAPAAAEAPRPRLATVAGR